MSSGDTSCRGENILSMFRQLEDSMVKVCYCRKEHAFFGERNVPHFMSHFLLLYCLLLSVNEYCGLRMKCRRLFYAFNMVSHSKEYIPLPISPLWELRRRRKKEKKTVYATNFELIRHWCHPHNHH